LQILEVDLLKIMNKIIDFITSVPRKKQLFS